MEKFTEKKITEFYKKIGLTEAEFFDGKKPINLFKILKISPEIDGAGNRKLTPYELLGIVPIFENGKEVPIVFAIKNRVKKIGNYEGNVKEFLYKNQKTKQEKTVIQDLKEKYRLAIMSGDDATAEFCLDTLTNLSADEAQNFKDSFYNYTKFYKRMKKQLLIDLFAHFFLEYMQMRKSAIIKNGIIKKDKLFKAYKENKSNYVQDVTLDADLDVISVSPSINPINFGMKNIKKVVIENKETNETAKFEIDKDKIKVESSINIIEQNNKEKQIGETNLTSENQANQNKMINQNQNYKAEIKQEEQLEDFDMGFFETVRSFINKKRKPLKRLGMVQPIMQNESDDKSFSKIEKAQSKEREIEI